jgi:hypothetical protein
MVRFEEVSSVLAKPVGNGEFGCCEMNHELRQPDGTIYKISCDKPRLGPVIMQMIEHALARHLEAGEIFIYRHLLMASRMLLKGLAMEEPPWHSSMEEFLQKYCFSSPTDNTKYPNDTKERGGITGMTPLFYAAAVGALRVIREMLAQPGVLEKINLQQKMSTIGDIAPIASSSYGDSPIYGTTLLTAAYVNGDPAVLQLLFENGADLTRLTTGGPNVGYSVLSFLSIAGHVDGIEWLHQLLTKEAWLSATKHMTSYGMTPVAGAMLYDSGPAANFLLAHGADAGNVNVEASGVTNLTYGARVGKCKQFRGLLPIYEVPEVYFRLHKAWWMLQPCC